MMLMIMVVMVGPVRTTKRMAKDSFISQNTRTKRELARHQGLVPPSRVSKNQTRYCGFLKTI